MAETRTKVYHSLQEQQRDEADAAAHGWRVVSRDSEREGYRVTYELGSEWTNTPGPTRGRRGLRRATLLVILWNAALALLWTLSVPWARDSVNAVYDETITRFGQTALTVGLGVIWFIGFLVTGLIWFMSRPRT